MKKILNLQVLFALLVAVAPLGAMADTLLFSFNDNFSNGSTTNGLSLRGGSPAASYTSYDIASGKNTIPGTNGVTIAPNDLHLALAAQTSSGFWEAQALFVTNSPGGTNAVVLTQPGDYISLTVVFTNTIGTLLPGNTSFIYLGLYSSGGSYPLAGDMAQSGLTGTTGSPYATGNCANWQGYWAQIANGGTSRIVTRPLQTGATTSAAQSLVGSGNTGQFANPTGATVETAPGAASYTFTAGGTYTMQLIFTMTAANVMTVSNYLYSGPDTNGTLLLAHGTTNVSGSTFLTPAFDGIAIGVLNKVAGNDPVMDVSSIQITGQASPPVPPTITSQPVPVVVATNGSTLFSVTAVGPGLSYQWHRNGTNLLNGSNISGATGNQLFVSPAGTNDALSSANGYYVTVTGAGNLSTNSVTNSLTLVAAQNLIWTDDNPNNIWDLRNIVNWKDANNNATVFGYGDSVTFDDTGAGGAVVLTGSYLSAASVTVNSSFQYAFSGSGSFAGPGNLIYKGPAQLTLGNANTYTGGTIISNASAHLLVNNYNGLGTGPVTLALAGGYMEIGPAGSATVGVNGDIVVADDFTIQFDGLGTFSGVLLGNLSGTAGKTLRLAPIGSNTSTNARVRIYGVNTTNNANLWLDSSNDTALITLAPYNPSGSQTYNGVISGNGSLIQRANGTTFLNGANTYSGGTTPTTGSIGFGIDSSPTVGTVVSGPIGAGPLYIAPEVNTANGSGTVFASGGSRTILNPIQYPSGTNNQILVIGGTNDLRFNGSFTLNGNDGIISNTITARTIQVNNTNGLTTISGVISDLTNGVSAAYGLVKTGAGVLVLNNTETYTGPTTVSGGTLQVNGALNAASAVTVTNATLAGTGIVNGPVTITTNGILASGAANIGTLSINNNLTLAGNMKVRVATAPGFPFPPVSNDKVVVSGSLTNAGTGTVTVNNLGPALQGGEILFLFNKPLINGGALTITGAGMSWQNNLAIDGTISVLGVAVLVPTNSARITGFNLANTNVVINGTNGQSGGTYYLLASTDVAKPLGQWTAVATNIVNTNGASGAFTFTGTNVAGPGAGQQFYILSNTNNH